MTDELDVQPEPLFVPGEEVQIQGFTDAGFDHECVMITWTRYQDQGWWYSTEHVNESYGFSEGCLVKLPKDQVTQWNTCIWQPREEE